MSSLRGALSPVRLLTTATEGIAIVQDGNGE
jgi:hypothetical protein